ncbi:HD domain-containing phosphohydrolase [Halochromatium glycolicum]|uniref:HD-GYP domain-containing protein n=1 Tax=Halochromatium glycolicum TaxID=85075 RepID=A0AAJ0X942_9GAMM|nr:HD domain-containing phosphohydrolase [Halochromatium glycolicum]MBK1703297.1 hypothetical protein [Halochromatium glycolicum]
MTEPEGGYKRVSKRSEVQTLLGVLSEPGGASLVLEDEDGRMMPVLVADQQPGEHMLLDISAVREIAHQLRRGHPFRLVGQTQGMMVRTPVLKVSACRDRDGRLQCQCNYPRHLEVLERRQFFRARLRLGMEVGAIVRNEETAAIAQGDLKNLSLDGCLLELPPSAISMLGATQPLEIELCFPNGTRFAIKGLAKHHDIDLERQLVQVGLQFRAPSITQERQLWQFVREIERESARHSTAGGEGLLRSLLFQTDPKSPPPIARRNAQRYATPMAKRLARVAGYLDAQLIELQNQSSVDSVQLSRHADRLLVLHEEDREAVLFAVRCLFEEAPLVRHCLSVAVQLVDMAVLSKMPRDACKAVAACAMVHDMGKALLPAGLLKESKFDAQQRAELSTHVARLMGCLEHCPWLSASVVKSIVAEINERLDGTGYPAGLGAADLGELSRLAMVVDVIDAMRRDRADRPAWRVADIYQHLREHPERFDPRWLKRYWQAFGTWPIGSLVRFETGALGWVQRLDGAGEIAQVQLTEAVKPPDTTLGEVLDGKALQGLGKPVEELPVSL